MCIRDSVSRALKSVQDFQSGGNRLGAVSQKFVDVLSKEILPTLEQKTSYRNPNIPATMEYLIKVENAIQKTLAKYELTKQVKQEKKRLEAMTSTQRATSGWFSYVFVSLVGALVSEPSAVALSPAAVSEFVFGVCSRSSPPNHLPLQWYR